MSRPLALAADVVLVVLFAAVGRATHEESLSAGGVIGTAWPFLVGLLVGWVVVLATGRRPVAWSSGVLVWACTVVGGMLLRSVSDAGTALPFVVVASLVTFALLVGWRLTLR